MGYNPRESVENTMNITGTPNCPLIIGNPFSTDHPKDYSLFGLGLPGVREVYPNSPQFMDELLVLSGASC